RGDGLARLMEESLPPRDRERPLRRLLRAERAGERLRVEEVERVGTGRERDRAEEPARAAGIGIEDVVEARQERRLREIDRHVLDARDGAERRVLRHRRDATERLVAGGEQELVFDAGIVERRI